MAVGHAGPPLHGAGAPPGGPRAHGGTVRVPLPPPEQLARVALVAAPLLRHLGALCSSPCARRSDPHTPAAAPLPHPRLVVLMSHLSLPLKLRTHLRRRLPQRLYTSVVHPDRFDRMYASPSAVDYVHASLVRTPPSGSTAHHRPSPPCLTNRQPHVNPMSTPSNPLRTLVTPLLAAVRGEYGAPLLLRGAARRLGRWHAPPLPA